MSPSDRFSVPVDVMARVIGGETVLLDLAAGMYFGLDATGTRAWALLAEGRTLAEVCAAMAQEFDAPADVIEADVFELARTLVERRLIQPA